MLPLNTKAIRCCVKETVTEKNVTGDVHEAGGSLYQQEYKLIKEKRPVKLNTSTFKLENKVTA